MHDWPMMTKELSAQLRNLRGGASEVMKAFAGMAQAATALPNAGTCVAPMPPMMRAMIYLPAAMSFCRKSSTDMPVCCAPMSCMLRPKMPASLAR